MSAQPDRGRPARMRAGAARSAERPAGTAAEVFWTFLRLGLTSFGGPVAHLGYFRAECVERRKWLDEHSYADIVALCQFLPGPASSQVGMSIGILRAGLPGALAAWLGFTMPSALAMILFGYGVSRLRRSVGRRLAARAEDRRGRGRRAGGVGHGAQPRPDRERATIAVGAAILALAVPTASGQVGAIVAGGLIGCVLLADRTAPRPHAPLAVHVPRRWSIAAAILFFALLVGLPPLAATFPSQRARAVRFVLPLGRAGVRRRACRAAAAAGRGRAAGLGVERRVSRRLWRGAGGAGAAVHLLGLSRHGRWRRRSNGWVGGLLCLVAIFLPSFLLLVGALPFWDALRRRAAVQAALLGINAAVVGLLLAALYRPVWTSAIFGPADFALGLVAFLLLALWAVPPWLVVILGAVAASAVAML